MNNPVKTFRCGPVTAAVWSNAKTVDETMVEMHSVKIDKVYRDEQEWKHTNSFTAEDLPKIAMLANEVYRYLRVRSSEDVDH